jgi:hypothetical protein
MLVKVKFDSKSPFVPDIEVPFEVDSLGSVMCEELKRIILLEEPIIMHEYNPYKDGVPEQTAGLEDWVTSRAFEYNLLKMGDKYPVLVDLKSFILYQYRNYVKELSLPEEEVYIQCWINVLRKDSRYFSAHHHAHFSRIGDQSYAYVSGNICIDAENTSTYYANPFLDKKKISIKNIPSESVLFPSWVVHATDQNKSENPRISIAFDIITKTSMDLRQMDNPDNFIRLNDE